MLKQGVGGLIWALFIVLSPMEVLVIGAVVWVPLLIWRERVRAARHGFWPGLVTRLGVVLAVVVVALLAPTKHEDGRVGPLPRSEVNLGELAAAGVIYPHSDRQHDSVRVSLPSVTPTRQEVMTCISEQTGFKPSIFHCGNGATILFGSGGGRIRIQDGQRD